MPTKPKTEEIHLEDARESLLDAALMHVVFDGWCDATFKSAVEDSGVDEGLALQACPRKGLDLAVAFHRSGDQKMVEAMKETDLSIMKYRDRVTFAVRSRLEFADKEAVRRGAALFALPQHAAEGASLVWNSASLIWETLGDTSTDVNWYTKRATLSAVYSANLLFWLGDESEGDCDTWAFLDRRIDDVMQIEVAKSKLRENPLVKSFVAGPGRIFEHVKAPQQSSRADLPGYVAPKG